MSPTLENGWVNWDDPGYVVNNALVHSLSWDAIVDMFTTLQVQGAYHPLTLLSWAVDYSIAGPNPQFFHAVNLILHLANTALVFWFIYLLCGRAKIAALTALLFGIHPMHLGPVAWISSRKDLLCAFFYLASLITYLKFLKNDDGRRRLFALCLVSFLFALLSKGVAMTLPVAMLAIDYWFKREQWGRRLLEKTPFFVLSIIFGIVAVAGQQSGKAMEDFQAINYFEAFFAGFYGLAVYFIKTLIPFQLSAFHPYPVLSEQSQPWYFYSAILPVLVLFYFCFRFRKGFPALIFGVMLFLIVIAPVLQFLPIGEAIIAERYTYLSYVGLFFVLVVGGARVLEKIPAGKKGVRKVVCLAIIVYLGIISIVTFQRGAVWQNGETLWTDVIEKYPTHYFSYRGRASWFTEQGNTDQAIADYSESIRLNPDFYEGYNNRGFLYLQAKKYDLALADFGQSITIKPDFVFGYANRGLVYFTAKQYQKALDDFEQAVELAPGTAANYANRGLAHQRLENLQQALFDFNRAIELDPKQPIYYKDRGFLFGVMNQHVKALADFGQAIELNPGYAEAYYWRSIGYFDLKQFDLAQKDALRARELGYPVGDEYLNSLRF